MMIKKFISIALVLSFTALAVSAEEESVTKASEEVLKVETGSLSAEPEEKLQVYELVNDNLRPEPDEFYLSTIYGTPDNPRALIKRSNNVRSGELFTGTVEYTIGDKISDSYVIYDIDFRHREVITQNIETGEYYALKLSYGTAKSKLIKKYDYMPPKKSKS